ncbi:dephospho-CoA kinase [Knoellia flava TL1]|uniref:Dephospho-CoA kinase n=2 Tax=Knoellia flava TaxID=913969 RepID=A0A8H9KPT6_9MICO|nr:dephospho-CoA kinase [Knoellia flava]KGN29241.1 dephospho-CoA kinase [Knoellia flava TL1]GGB67498.1 dephospho-CoA kinase [Knoellia flava]
MLRVGLTGGIGSGKSTVARTLADLGAVVVDADAVAREVVEPGMPALTAIRERFGDDVFGRDGALDRPALGRVVFGDPAALADLEAITHPAIWRRTAQLLEQAPNDAVLVHDMPLIVEKSMGADYHLVVVVGATEEERLARLVRDRGMDEQDARSRIAAQADDDARRAAADVWLDNHGTPEQLGVQVRRLWAERFEPFNANLLHGIRARRPDALTISEPREEWTAQAARLVARVEKALGERAVTVEHIGSTSVPGLPAKDVIDLQVGVASLDDADEQAFVDALARCGFPRVGEVSHDNGKDGQDWPKRFHASADPGRMAHVHVREVGSPGYSWARRFRDWLRVDEAARSEYAALKMRLLAQGLTPSEYADAKEPWFDSVHERVRGHAAHSPG